MDARKTRIDEETLVRQTARMRRLARGLLRDYDRAEDVVQETTLRALTGRIRPRTTPAACLGGAVRNLAWKLRRSERRRGAHEARAARDPRVPATADLLIRLDEQRRVLDAVRALPAAAQEAILLRYFDGLPPRRIAAHLDVPVETVKSRLKRGLALLRRRLDDAHGGQRRPWMSALLPVAGWGHLLAASTASPTAAAGGVMAKSTSTKLSLSLAVLLLGGAAAFFATDGFGLRDGEEPGLSTGTGAEPEAGLAADAGLEGRESALPTEAAPDGAGDAAAPDATPEEPTEEAAPGTPPPPKPRVRPPSTLPPVRHSPFAPPAPPKGRPLGVPGGGGGWGGPTGHWTRFPLAPPPRGTARLTVTVTDEGGLPIEGATVYIGPEDVAGKPAVSYGSLRKLGTTNARGLLEHRELTPGTVAVCANVGAVLTGRFGLDTRPAEVVTLRNGAAVAATLKLPLSAKDLGAVEGRVTDPEGNPVSGVQVAVGNNVVRTDREGRYRLLRVPAGTQQVHYSRWAWTPITEELEVRAGTTAHHDVTMDHAEKGNVTVRGVVVGPTGLPIEGCAVYLNGKNATLRATRTDAEGHFEMAHLPERVRTQKVEVQASGIPRYGSARVPFEDGIADGTEVRIEIPTQYVKVAFALLDAATGDPVERARVTALRDGDDKKRPGGLWYSAKSQRHEGILQPGRYHVTIDALDHQGTELDLDVPAQEEFRHTLRLTRTAPDSVDVHLLLEIHSGSGEDPVKRAKIEILDRKGTPLSTFEGRRTDGRYLLPAPSGKRILRITAEGHEPYEAPLDLAADVLDLTQEIHLRPK